MTEFPVLTRILVNAEPRVIRRLMPGLQGPPGLDLWAETRAALALKPRRDRYYLMEEGREGIFKWVDEDLSAQVTIDTEQGIHVAPTLDPTGQTGAFVRVFSGPANIRWFGATGDPADDQTAALRCARNCFNESYFDELDHPGGDYKFSEELPKILRQQGNILGAGKQISRLISAANGVGDFGFFTLGDDTHPAGRVNIDGFSLVNESAAMDTAFAVTFANGSFSTLQNILMIGVSRGIALGNATNLCVRPTLYNIRIELDVGHGGAGVKVFQAGDIRASFVKVVARNEDEGDEDEQDPDIIGFHYENVGVCDTSIWFRCQANFPGKGVNRCLVIDGNGAVMANQWFVFCVFDHGHEACIDFMGTDPAGIMRRFWFIACRAFASGGHAYRMQSSIACELTDVHLMSCELTGGSDVAFNRVVEIPRSTARRVYITQTAILDAGAIHKMGIAIGIDEWIAQGNIFMPRVIGTPMNIDYAIDITSDLSDYFVATDNVARDLNNSFVREPVYQTFSQNRIIRNNTEQASTESGRLPIPDGSLAVPGLYFTNDQDTGIRRVSGKIAALVANSIESMQWSANGTKVTDLTPGYDLDLSGLSSTPAPRFTSYRDGAGHIIISTRASRGSRASKAALIAADQLGQWQTEGFDGTDFQSLARVIAKCIGNLSGTNRGSAWEFETVQENTISAPSKVLTIGRGIHTTNAVGGDRGLDTINTVKYHIGQIFWSSGFGTPEGVVTAQPGSLYTDQTGGKLYVKETGVGNTGWVIK